MMTDYQKWSKMNFKELGLDSDEEGQTPATENSKQPSATEEYVARVKEAEQAKLRLAQLEKEQLVLEKQLAQSMKRRNDTDFYTRIAMVVLLIAVFLAHHFIGDML